MSLGWIPRLQNEEADAITNEDYKSFVIDRRILTTVEEAAKSFVLLPQLLKAGEQIQGIEAETAKGPGPGAAKTDKKKAVLRPRAQVEAKPPPAPKKKKRKKRPLDQRLRATQPW